MYIRERYHIDYFLNLIKSVFFIAYEKANNYVANEKIRFFNN